jgi:hypothetical protein
MMRCRLYALAYIHSAPDKHKGAASLSVLLLILTSIVTVECNTSELPKVAMLTAARSTVAHVYLTMRSSALCRLLYATYLACAAALQAHTAALSTTAAPHTNTALYTLRTLLQVPAMGGIPGTIVCDHGRLERIPLAPTALEKSAGEHGGLLVIASDGVWDALPVLELSKTLQELNLHDLDDDRRSGKADAYDSIGGSAVARVWDEKIEEGTVLYYIKLYNYTILYCTLVNLH